MIDVMLDNETLSLKPNAAVISIGAVRFDPITGETGEKFYEVINPGCYKNFPPGKFDIDVGTVFWWMKQDDDARREFEEKEPLSLPITLLKFEQFFNSTPDSVLWSHEDFDRCCLANMYDAFKLPVPWHFRNVASLRSFGHIFDRLGIERPTVDGGDLIEHNAIHDALYQVEQVRTYMDALRNHNAG